MRVFYPKCVCSRSCPRRREHNQHVIILNMPTRTKKEIAPVIEAVEVEQPVQQEDTVTFKRSHFYAVLVVLAFAAGILVGYVAWGTEAAQSAQTANQANGPVAPGAPVATDRKSVV